MTSEDRLKKALKAFERLWKECGDDYWIFAATGTLCLMRKENGDRMLTDDGCMDPAAIVQSYEGIECDGGDW